MLKVVSIVIAGLCLSQSSFARNDDRKLWVCYKEKSNVMVTSMTSGPDKKTEQSQLIYAVQEKDTSTGLTTSHYFLDPFQHYGDDQHHHITVGSSTQSRNIFLVVSDFKMVNGQKTGLGKLELTVPRLEKGAGNISLVTTTYENLDCTLQQD